MGWGATGNVSELATFIASSDEPGCHEYFNGYGYSSSHFVSGDAGHTQYREWSGRGLAPGGDGSYVVSLQTPTGYRIGTDGLGMRKIFLYRQGRHWAISDSFYSLVRLVRKKDWSLTLRPELLRQFSVRGTFTSQLTSAQSFFSQIRMLRSRQQILVEKGRLVVAPVEHGLPSSIPVPYATALSSFLDLWRNRLATVFSDARTTFTLDLKGERESRLGLALTSNVGLLGLPNSWMGVQPHGFSEAQEIENSALARRYGILLGKPVRVARKVGSGSNALELWRRYSLGVNLPVNLSRNTYDSLDFNFKGISVSSKEKYSDAANVRQKIGRYSYDFKEKEFKVWKALILNDSQVSPDEFESLSAHYLEHRHRFSVGTYMQRRSSFAPLNSSSFKGLVDGYQEIGHKQIYRDMIHALDGPELDSTVSFSDGERSRSPVAVNVSHTPDAGHVFSGGDRLDSVVPDAIDPYRAWVEEAQEKVMDVKVREFVGSSVIERADHAVEVARASTRSLGSHDRRVLDLSYCVTVAFGLGRTE